MEPTNGLFDEPDIPVEATPDNIEETDTEPVASTDSDAVE